MLSRFVIAFLPRSKHLLISWLQSPSASVSLRRFMCDHAHVRIGFLSFHSHFPLSPWLWMKARWWVAEPCRGGGTRSAVRLTADQRACRQRGSQRLIRHRVPDDSSGEIGCGARTSVLSVGLTEPSKQTVVCFIAAFPSGNVDKGRLGQDRV